MTTMPDPPPRRPRQQAGAISTVLKGLRRRVQRGSRDVIETAVSQLFDAAVHPHGVAASGEYRIDDLARLAGTTTRNIRVYRDRGLLHPPLRVGRIALFNDTHLTRLRLITSLLDRGYNIAHVHEMLSAWEQGKDLGSVLGLESAIAGTWAAEKPQTMTVADARRLINDEAAFDRLVGSGLIRLEDDDAVVVRMAIAGNPSTGPDALRRLADDADAQVRSRTVANPGLPDDTFRQLVNDASSDVRATVAASDRVSPELFGLLAHDADPAVCAAVAQNPACPVELLDELVGVVPETVLSNPQTPEHLLSAGSQVRSPQLRAAVAANPATPTRVLETLSRDPSDEVRDAVAENPSSSPRARRRARKLAARA